MKKIFKMAFAVVAIASVGLGSYKAYGSYTAANMSEESLLMAENVLALSDATCDCKNITCYSTITPSESCTVVFCSDCESYPDMTDVFYSPSNTCLRKCYNHVDRQ